MPGTEICFFTQLRTTNGLGVDVDEAQRVDDERLFQRHIERCLRAERRRVVNLRGLIREAGSKETQIYVDNLQDKEERKQREG